MKLMSSRRWAVLEKGRLVKGVAGMYAEIQKKKGGGGGGGEGGREFIGLYYGLMQYFI